MRLFHLPLLAFSLAMTASLAGTPSDEVLPPSPFLNPKPTNNQSTSSSVLELEEKQPIDWSKTIVSRDIAGRSIGLDNESWEKQYRDGQSAYFFGQYQQALNLWLPLAQGGHADAQASLGWLYQSGRLGRVDLSQALHWYRLSAAQGQSVAQNNLGVCYEQGIGVAVDRQKALHWYRLSAAQHYRFGQYNAGVLLASGDDNEKKEAITWLRAAATQGVTKASEVLKKLTEK